MAIPPIYTHSAVAMSDFSNCTRHLHQLYKANVPTVQGCTRLPNLKDFKRFSQNYLLISFLKRRHASYSLLISLRTHSLECASTRMMNGNLNWDSFSPFSLTHDIGQWLFSHLHSFSGSYVGFVQLYKAFTLSVQGQCANCTRVYKAT